MSKQNIPTRFATAFVLSLAFLTAACSEDPTGPTSTSTPTEGRFATSAASAPGYTVLANAAVTCTDGMITGSVGTFQATPTGAITLHSCPVSGSIDTGTGASIAAYNSFLATYAALAPKSDDVCTMLTGTLADVTLAPGAYCFPAAATLTGTLTLSGPANGVWSFKVGTLGTGALTGTNFSVVLANGANACNVTWWVAEAATMTTSNFQGNILAGGAITLTDGMSEASTLTGGTSEAITLTGGTFTGGTLNGDIWSKAGVTITSTAVTGCDGRDGRGHRHKHKHRHGHGKKDKDECNQGIGNGREGCDPGDSNHHHDSNDEDGATPGHHGRR